jgi:precorrin-2 dehydrogenase/sirohydrochlorin ferrochelatase
VGERGLMLPVALNAALLPLLLVGRGPRLARRIALLREGGAADLALHSDDAAFAAEGAVKRMPGAVDLAGKRIVYVVGLDETESARIATLARQAGALVNVEDIPRLCDFYSPSVLRRGDLVIAVSSAGTNPSLSKLVVRWLAQKFGPEWVGYGKTLAERRAALRQDGLSGAALFSALEDHVARSRWLDR